MTVSVAFVCLGNICRSPMAEAVFANAVNEAGLSDTIKVDSFGTASYHVGDQPDPRTLQTCKSHKVPVNHRGQQIKSSHFSKFDYILAMDRANLENLKRIAPKDTKTKIQLFGDYRQSSTFNRIVEDPYYGGLDGFEHTFEQTTDFSAGLLKEIKDNL